MNTATNSTLLLARAGLSAMFVFSGLAKIGAHTATQAYMESKGVPSALLPLVIFAEVGGGLAVLTGLFTRTAALGLALFTVAAGILFHNDFADQNQMTQFFKNITIAAGFVILAVQGAGRFSLDAWRDRRENALRPALRGAR